GIRFRRGPGVRPDPWTMPDTRYLIPAASEDKPDREFALLPSLCRRVLTERVRQRVAGEVGADPAKVIAAEQIEHLSHELDALPPGERGRLACADVEAVVVVAVVDQRNGRQAV